MKRIASLAVLPLLLIACGDGPDGSINPSDVANAASVVAPLASSTAELEAVLGGLASQPTICDEAADIANTACANDPRGLEPFEGSADCRAEAAAAAQCVALRGADASCDAVLECGL